MKKITTCVAMSIIYLASCTKYPVETIESVHQKLKGNWGVINEVANVVTGHVITTVEAKGIPSDHYRFADDSVEVVSGIFSKTTKSYKIISPNKIVFNNLLRMPDTMIIKTLTSKECVLFEKIPHSDTTYVLWNINLKR